MTGPRLSVVVASAGRPRLLARCLTALGQLRSTRFEVIVVADAAGLAVARSMPFADRLTLLPQAQENIAMARNAGISAAAGEIFGFLDDDAVPEPDWAEALLRGFEDPEVDAVTGPVIGRNGISLQWGRMATDLVGRDRWLPVGEGPAPGEVVKLNGTNMAVRRKAMAGTGGFDTGFRFYLDETDLGRRLGSNGRTIRYLPGAVVHHGFAASVRRADDRTPLDLTDIGASTAYFLRKHAPHLMERELDALLQDQRNRLMRLVRRRKIGPGELAALMESLVAGIAEGRVREGEVPAVSNSSERGFVEVRHVMPPELVRLSGWSHRAGALRRDAAARVRQGEPVALLLLEPTPRKHRLAFTEGGWWEQHGGLFGPSERTGPRLQLWRMRTRAAAEAARFPTRLG